MSPKKFRSTVLATTAAIFVAGATISGPAVSQAVVNDGRVYPMGRWLEYRDVDFSGSPILVHLRTSYERAFVMPEDVQLLDPEQKIPGCDIVINGEVIAFYPSQTFNRRSVIFVGRETGTQYNLRVRASPEGIRQPMRINSSAISSK